MIIFGALIVVVIVTVIFYLRKPKEYKWWEFTIPLLITLGMIFGAKALTDHIGVMFTEYWGESIVEIYEEEPWNEWIHKTCTETYPCGTDSDGNTTYCTRTYDCSYQADYGPEWYCKTDMDNKYRMTEHLYDSLVRVYITQKIKVKTHRNHASRDRASRSNGTKFAGTKVGKVSYVWKFKWPQSERTRKGVFTKHRYENRIKASDLSVFNIAVVTEEEADSLGLYEYPEDIHKYNCPTILGGNVSPETQENFRKLNGKFGPTNQLRLWILLFEDKPAITATYQENYWVKGNKNELIICIGVNENEVQWAHSFSWALSGTLTAEAASKVLEMYEYTAELNDGSKTPAVLPITKDMAKNIFKDMGVDEIADKMPEVFPIPLNGRKVVNMKKSSTPVLTDETWEAYYKYMLKNLNRFERRSFEEFSYITVDPKPWAIILIYGLALVISLGLNLWVSNNEFHDKPNRYNRRY